MEPLTIVEDLNVLEDDAAGLISGLKLGGHIGPPLRVGSAPNARAIRTPGGQWNGRQETTDAQYRPVPVRGIGLTPHPCRMACTRQNLCSISSRIEQKCKRFANTFVRQRQ